MLATEGQNTQRVISNDKLINDTVQKPMPRKKKVIIAISIFIAIAAIVGIAVGLYFHFRPTSNHIYTVVSQGNDGTVHSATKFQYIDNNMIGNSTNQTFTIMFAGLNSSQVQRRMLQSSQSDVHADTTLHYTHESGIKIKFRDNEVVNISVPIDQVVEYIAQQSDPEQYARLLQADYTQYNGEDQTISGSDVFDSYRAEVLSAIQSIYSDNTNVHVYMRDIDMYELDFDENSGKYKYTNASLTTARRLWSFRHFFHRVGDFVKRAAHDVVHFVKKDGLKILKYGAIAALAGIDIAAKGPSGISDAVKMFKSGNILTALELTAEGVATRLPAYLSIPIEFVAAACFSHPPKMHCTKQAAINAVKSDVIGYLKKHALSTALSLLQ